MNNNNNKTYYNLIPILFFLLTVSLSCIVTHKGNRTLKYNDSSTMTPKIILLNYSIRSDKSKAEPEVRLIDKQVAEGKLKMVSQKPEMSKPGDLKCISLNNRLEPVDSIIITDPLNITVESVDATNDLFKKEIELDSAQFSIRMQLSESTYAYAIKKKTDYKHQNSYLVLTKIK